MGDWGCVQVCNLPESGHDNAGRFRATRAAFKCAVSRKANTIAVTLEETPDPGMSRLRNKQDEIKSDCLEIKRYIKVTLTLFDIISFLKEVSVSESEVLSQGRQKKSKSKLLSN